MYVEPEVRFNWSYLKLVKPQGQAGHKADSFSPSRQTANQSDGYGKYARASRGMRVIS